MSREPISGPEDEPQPIEDLWDDCEANPEDFPIPDWVKEELDRRRGNLENNPGSALTWEETVDRIRKRYGR